MHFCPLSGRRWDRDDLVGIRQGVLGDQRAERVLPGADGPLSNLVVKGQSASGAQLDQRPLQRVPPGCPEHPVHAEGPAAKVHPVGVLGQAHLVPPQAQGRVSAQHNQQGVERAYRRCLQVCRQRWVPHLR